MTDNRPIDLDIEGLEDPVEIGVGGFATVYKAYQPAFRRTVAVKVLATLNLDDASRERFERECQAMGSLSEHPNIVTVYGAGFTNSGRPYLVMAYLPGGSLQERLDREGAIPWVDATLAGVHLAGALETAHRAQIVHRDIKPGNVLMSTYGDAQLTDFGIARISGGHETRSGVITASMAHAPPEVLDGQKPTVAADVYSLGSTIFELIRGTPAFAAAEDESMVPMLRRILTDPPPDLRPLGVPDQVCQVIERAMSKQPEHRQATAVLFGRELQAARRANGLEAGKLTVPADVSVDVEQGQEISFVAAPFTGPVDSMSGHPTAPPSPAASVTAPVAPAAYPTQGPIMAPGAAPMAPTYEQPVAPAYDQGYAPTLPPPVAPVAPGYAQPIQPPGLPPVDPYVTGPVPGTPHTPKKSKALVGALIALAVLVVVVLGGLAAARSSSTNNAVGSTTTATTAKPGDSSSTVPSDSSTTAKSGDSSSTVPSDSSTTVPSDSSTTATTADDTSTTNVADYTAEQETSFVEDCVAGPADAPTTSTPTGRRLLCRCVFKGIKEQIPYARYLEIEQDVQNGASLAGTEIQAIIDDCSEQFPNAG